MNTQEIIRELNKKAKEQSEPFNNQNEMPYLKESWDRHSCVREMWSNPHFSHREVFKTWGCWWFQYTSVQCDEYLANQNIYKEMKKFSQTDEAVYNPCFQKLWRTIDNFFALYYLEFPFWVYPNPPEFDFDSVEDFRRYLSK